MLYTRTVRLDHQLYTVLSISFKVRNDITFNRASLGSEFGFLMLKHESGFSVVSDLNH